MRAASVSEFELLLLNNDSFEFTSVCCSIAVIWEGPLLARIPDILPPNLNTRFAAHRPLTAVL